MFERYESKQYACCLAFPNKADRGPATAGFLCYRGDKMKEHGLYIIKREYLKLVHNIGGDCDYSNGDKRPVYCCIKDNRIDGLYWAIPTSDIDHRNEKQKQYYELCLEKPEKDLRSCYYHIGRTTKKALYKISSCYPITEKYIDHEFISCGKHIVVRRAETVKELERKLKRILAFESRRPNYFKQHITDVKNYLIDELNENNILPTPQREIAAASEE